MRLPACSATALPARHASGKGDAFDPGIVKNAGHSLGFHKQILEHARGESGAAEDVFDGESALRHVRGVLQQHDIPGHERPGGGTEHLPEGEVPRHDGQHGAQRLVANEAAGGVGGDHLVGQEALGIFRVVAASHGAFFRFLDGGSQGLAHFQGHEATELRLFRIKDARRFQQKLGAFCDGKVAIGGESRSSDAEPAFQLGVRGGVKALHQLAGGGIHGGEGLQGKSSAQRGPPR